MFYEYALEPTVICSWERARYFLDAVGPWKGRFLAKLPKTWARAVLDGLTCGDVEKKRIEAKLEQVIRNRCFSLRVVGEFRPTISWLDNARAEHARREFRAIIAAVGSGGPPVLDAGSVDESEPLWRVEQGQLVARDSAVIAQAVGHLLAVSRHLLVIDPYFRANHPTKSDVLSACCLVLPPTGSRVDVHAALGGERDPTYDQAKADALRLLPRILPTGLTATVSFWLPRNGGQRLHNRYLLTEVGGVQFGDGIERGAAGQYDRVSIVEDPSRIQIWNDFMGAVPSFDPAGAPFAVKGTRSR
jgi:hypothetical protein